VTPPGDIDATGVWYAPALLDAAAIAEVRDDVLAVCERRGVIVPGDPAAPRVAAGRAVFESSSAEWLAVYFEILSLRSLNALTARPELLAVARALVGDDALVHPRVICRLFANYDAAFATPPHRDLAWNGGSERAWTAWIALIDVPAELGGLVVLPGSHRRDVALRGRDEREGYCLAADEPWLAPSYRAGDAMLFHCRVIHGAGGNRLPDRLRLSAEVRFQPLADPVRFDSLEPHWAGHGLTWERVCAGWDHDDPLRYAWRRQSPQVVADDDGSSFQQDIRRRYLQNWLRLQAGEG
jgi:ectoine hydroxylase-related dioxygenase (phytanoyl-CoA dioxygenase family)